jgi:hypothetical protein
MCVIILQEIFFEASIPILDDPVCSRFETFVVFSFLCYRVIFTYMLSYIFSLKQNIRLICFVEKQHKYTLLSLVMHHREYDSK